MLTSEQIRAGRALLRWEQKDLARAAGISVETVKRLEKTPGQVRAYASTVAAVQTALETAGVEFFDDNGVRLRRRG